MAGQAQHTHTTMAPSTDSGRQEADDWIGSRRYRRIALLGEGGMGCVYEAEDAKTGDRVAVKVLHEKLASDTQSVERLRTEAEIPMLLQHPNIVRVLDLVFPPAVARPFFVMELLEGRSLLDHVHLDGPVPVGDAIEIARQALAGLAAAHLAGVVHRDVKLGNLFMCLARGSAPHVKLIDFGIAKLLPIQAPGLTPHSFRTREGAYLGTAQYASPEQASGKDVDPRTDVYAMGVVLYTMLAGRGPFDDVKGTASVLRAQIDRVPEPPSKAARSPVPPELDELIMNALAKNAEERLASADRFAAALEDIGRRLHAPAGWLKTHLFDASEFAADPTVPEPAPVSPSASTTDKMSDSWAADIPVQPREPESPPVAVVPESVVDEPPSAPNAPSGDQPTSGWTIPRFLAIALIAGIGVAVLVFLGARMVP